MKTLLNPKIIILEKYAVWVEQAVQRKIQYAGLALMASIELHTPLTVFSVWSLIQAALKQRLENLSLELSPLLILLV